MSLHKQPALKEAILNLSTKEKDKLLVRLISKDKMLMKQLHYQLLEDELDLEDRIHKLRNRLTELFEINTPHIHNVPMYSNYKTLNNLLRSASGIINEHEKVTKDKLSEIEFRMLILLEAFQRYPRLFEPNHLSIADKLQKYAVARIKSLLPKYNKLHEDLQFDLQEQLDSITSFATQHQLQ